MRRTRVTLGLTVIAVVLAVVAGAAGNDRSAAFRLPDASAACRLHGETLVCRSLNARTALALGRSGAPRRAVEPIWWDASTKVLQTWRHGDLTCSARAGQIVCVNRTGNSVAAGPGGIAAAL